VPPNIRIEVEQEHDQGCGVHSFRETRFVFSSEVWADVPCHLLIPQEGTAPFPVVICLQGHTTGMHISLARPKYEGDEELITGGDRDFALQAVWEGYAALVMEQRCFGERRDSRPPEIHPYEQTCRHAAMTALLLGRTMIGERTWDVSRAIDALAEFPEVDTGRIGCMGNSGGGTQTAYLMALDERINCAAPSCYLTN
jgi:cephalosporin-C deacetylase-like acetyl esterase